MKEMRVGDKVGRREHFSKGRRIQYSLALQVLFYHSNCKNPGNLCCDISW